MWSVSVDHDTPSSAVTANLCQHRLSNLPTDLTISSHPRETQYLLMKGICMTIRQSQFDIVSNGLTYHWISFTTRQPWYFLTNRHFKIPKTTHDWGLKRRWDTKVWASTELFAWFDWGVINNVNNSPLILLAITCNQQHSPCDTLHIVLQLSN